MQMSVKSTIELKFSNNAHVNAHMHNWGLTAQPQPEPKHHHKTAGGEKMLPRATNAQVSDHIHMWGYRDPPPPRTPNHYHKTTKSKKMLAHVNFQIHIKQSRIEHTTTTVTKPSSQGKCTLNVKKCFATATKHMWMLTLACTQLKVKSTTTTGTEESPQHRRWECLPQHNVHVTAHMSMSMSMSMHTNEGLENLHYRNRIIIKRQLKVIMLTKETMHIWSSHSHPHARNRGLRASPSHGTKTSPVHNRR